MATKKKRVTRKLSASAAPKKEVCCESQKGCCCFGWGLAVLIIGLLFVAKDYGLVNWFKFSWWTVVFVLLGLKWVFKKY